MNGERYDPWKHLIDVVVASALLVLTAPVRAFVALLVRRNLGSPVLFGQNRPSKDEQIFELVKFRTVKDVDIVAGLVTDEQRLTAFDAALRSTSLDELPTLWDVLKGEMNLVGPRALLAQYLTRDSADQHSRHEVRPVMTGLAQVSARNAITWEEKFAKGVEYVDERSTVSDARILLLTIAAAIRRDGISETSGVAMVEFGVAGELAHG